MRNFDRIKKSALFFLSCYSIEFIRHISFKVYKFLKTGVYGKCLLISSRGKFAETSLSKIDINLISQEFLFWLCPMKLSIGHNSLILKHKCVFIWCSYHFVLFFSILSQKEKFYVKQKHNNHSSCMVIFFVFYVGWTYILRGSLLIKVVSQWI